MAKDQGRSTRHIDVSGIKAPDAKITTVWYNKSKRQEVLGKFLAGSDETSKEIFLRYLFIHSKMLFNYSSASERLLLWFDNSAIQSVIHRDKSAERSPQFNSLLALLILSEDYLLVDIFCCISPTILFEANHRRTIENATDAKRVITVIDRAMEQIGLETQYVGFFNLKQLIEASSNLKQDEQAIFNAIKSIRNFNWRLDSLPGAVYDRVGNTPLPLSLAEHFTPNIRLTYFDPWYVKYIMMHMIVKELYDANEGVLPFRDYCKQIMNNNMHLVLNLRSGRLNGLGDIELYSSCELGSQTAVRSPYICMAISFDENLNRSLWSRMQTRGPSFGHKGGEPPEVFTSAWLYAMEHSQRVLEKANRRQKEYQEAMSRFYDNLLKPFLPETDCPRKGEPGQ